MFTNDRERINFLGCIWQIKINGLTHAKPSLGGAAYNPLDFVHPT